MSIIKERNIALVVILLVAVVMLVLIISVPSLQQLFSFQFPGYKHFISSLVGAGAMLIILETVKYFYIRRIEKID